MNEKVNPNTDLTLAEDLLELFRGDDERFGTFDPKLLHLDGDKMEMKDEHGRGPSDVKRPPTVADLQAHLDGEMPIGFWLARRDGLARRIVIDVDGKDMKGGGYEAISQVTIVRKVEKLGLSLVDERSKSGGLHLNCFLSEWIPQARANALGRKMAVLLGFPNAEVFPAANGPSNWVIVPYFGANKGASGLYCLSRPPMGKGRLDMSLADFRDFCKASVRTPEAFEAEIRKARPEKEKEGSGGPEYAKRKLDEFADEIRNMRDGERGNLLNKRAFQMGTMVGAGWIEESEVHYVLMKAAMECRDPLPAPQTDMHIRNGLRDGKEEKPIVDNDRIYPELEDGRVMIIWTGGEEPEWEFPLEHWGNLRMPSEHGIDYRIFRKKASKLGVAFQPMKEADWAIILQGWLQEAEIREIPKDETPQSLLLATLRVFLRHDVDTDDQLEQVMNGRTVRMWDEGRIYFRNVDLRHHIAQDRTRPLLQRWDQGRLGKVLASLGEEGKDWAITSKKLRYISDTKKGKTDEKKKEHVRWISIEFYRREIGAVAALPRTKDVI